MDIDIIFEKTDDTEFITRPQQITVKNFNPVDFELFMKKLFEVLPHLYLIKTQNR